MRQLKLSKAFTLIESGPVVLVTTNDGKKNNIMTISWTTVMDFTPQFALIKECAANIECKVVDIVSKHNIVVLEAIAAHIDPMRKETRRIHAVGDGTFIVDGRKMDRKKLMASKIPAGA
ncbi:MAG TPA: hypothetical protein PLU38_12905 [Kiritimatiellia bacterium]|nr:MAG: Flavin reductase like domain protein [Verrucomicrobia bacterium ADurb.Bin070]HPO37553.1 hypothetical protein [Kiritimatiellia bacterium]HQQ92752.1 hypothetical protein [Kiritimatiellia bacterium]